jgi:hypothetical protein
MPISLLNRKCATCLSVNVPKHLQAQANRTGLSVPLYDKCPSCSGPAFVHPDPKSPLAVAVRALAGHYLIAMAAGAALAVLLAR